MGRMGVRRAALIAALVTLTQVTAGFPASPGVAAVSNCAAPEQIFAVNGSTGHLVELASCPDAITEVGEVDTGDWRTSSRIFATGDETITVVYRVTADGRLEARRQTAPGAALEAPVQVGAGIDWLQSRTVLVPRRGFIWADNGDVRAFRHEGWATGGSTLVEGPPALRMQNGWAATGDLVLTGLGPFGRAEASFMGHHWRVWADGDSHMWARASGRKPFGASGTESGLYAVTGGAVVQLRQSSKTPPGTTNCPANSNPWQVRTSLPGEWWGFDVVVPQRMTSDTEWPAIAPPPTPSPGTVVKCPPGTEPYQWQ